MVQVTLTITVPDEIIARVRAENPSDFDDFSDSLWEDAENAVIDAVRATFTPRDLLEDPDA